MPGSWFVSPDVDTLTLTDGATLTVRRRLTAGESRARVERWTRVDESGALVAVPTLGGRATVTAYLLDWTVPDGAGVPMPIRGLSVTELETVVDHLLPERFAEILTAIESHEVAKIAERVEQKKNGWNDHVRRDLAIARRCGWRYEWVTELDADVYALLVESLTAEQTPDADMGL